MPIDMSMAPPKREGAAPPRAMTRRATVRDKRTEAVAGIGQLLQFGCVMTGNYADAAAIGIHAPNIGGEVVNLADQNETIAKGVDFLLEAGPYAGLIAATLPLVVQILANHRKVPADKIPGVLPPEALEAKMRAEIAKEAARVTREAQDAIREAQQAEADLASSVNGRAASESANNAS